MITVNLLDIHHHIVRKKLFFHDRYFEDLLLAHFKYAIYSIHYTHLAYLKPHDLFITEDVYLLFPFTHLPPLQPPYLFSF